MIYNQAKKDEQRAIKVARQDRILELANGLTPDEIVAKMADMGVKADTVKNDISQLKADGRLRSESAAPKFRYYRTQKYDLDATLSTSPIAMWGGYGTVKPAHGRQYDIDDFDHRDYPKAKTKAYVSGSSLEIIS